MVRCRGTKRYRMNVIYCVQCESELLQTVTSILECSYQQQEFSAGFRI